MKTTRNYDTQATRPVIDGETRGGIAREGLFLYEV